MNADIKTRYSIPQSVLDMTHDFLYRAGLKGCEGTGLWVGRETGDQSVHIVRFFPPEQLCTKTRFGISVDLTRKAHLALTDNLQSGERFFCRIHSHPTRAYHSQKDDQNPILTHRGAISIVVPNFAREPIDLAKCAIYRLDHGLGWLELSSADIRETFTIIR